MGTAGALPAISDNLGVQPMTGSQRVPGFPADLAEAIQARLRSDCEAEAPGEHHAIELLQAHIATLEATLAKAEEIGKQRKHEVEIATSRAADLQGHISTLETALTKADMAGKRWQREAELSAKRANDLVAELFKVTSELVEMSKRMAQQMALTDKLKAELDEHRARSWWWKHGIG
jgi:chromosome segregation ATPase